MMKRKKGEKKERKRERGKKKEKNEDKKKHFAKSSFRIDISCFAVFPLISTMTFQ